MASSALATQIARSYENGFSSTELCKKYRSYVALHIHLFIIVKIFVNFENSASSLNLPSSWLKIYWVFHLKYYSYCRPKLEKI